MAASEMVSMQFGTRALNAILGSPKRGLVRSRRNVVFRFFRCRRSNSR